MNPEPLVQEPAPKPKKSVEERWILKNISDGPIPQGTIPTRKGGDQLDCKGEPL